MIRLHDKPQVLLDTGEVVNISLMVKEDWRDITSHITVQMVGQILQTMQRYPEAEKMHLKAIQIKESLFGTEDYEVALSVGHLAPL